MKKILSLLLLSSTLIYAQPSGPSDNPTSTNTSEPKRHLNFERFLIAEDDGEQLITSYLAPAIVGVMNSSTASWYTTAETHERWGFDISVSGTMAFVPSSDTKFVIPQSSKFNISEGDELATIFGIIDHMPEMTGVILDGGAKYKRTIEAPTGAGLGTNVTPNAVFQGGIGVGWGTEVKVRFMPKVGNGTFKAGSWGLAIQHDISQYIPFEGKIPIFVSALVGYTSSYGTWKFDKPDDYAWNGENQMTDFDSQAWALQLMASTNFPVINFYGGFGYNLATGSYQMNGTYEVEYINEANHLDKITRVYENPANGSYTVNGVNATLGARLSLGAFKLYADYSFKNYNVLTLGMAVSFR